MLKWKDEFSVGVPMIDIQHKELLRRGDLVVKIMAKVGGKDKVKEQFRFLKVYIEEHFWLEQQYMEKHGYPGFAAHKKEHGVQAKKFMEIEKLTRQGKDMQASLELTRFLEQLINDHFAGFDMDMGAFLKEKGLGQVHK